MFLFRLSISFILIFLFGQFDAYAQDSLKLLSARFVDPQSGLSSSNVRKVITDEYGFVWIATQDGLNRYDGKRFISFNANENNDRARTIGNDFSEIIYDSVTKSIIASTSNGGLNFIDARQSFVRQAIQNHELFRTELSLDWIRKIVLSGNFVYVLSNRGLIAQYDIKKRKVHQIFSPLVHSSNDSLVIDNLYVINESKILLFMNNGSVSSYDPSFGTIKNLISVVKGNRSLGINFFHSYCKIEDNLIVGSEAGVVSISLLSLQSEPGLFGLIPDHILKQPLRAVYSEGSKLYFANQIGLFCLDLNLRSFIRIVPTLIPVQYRHEIENVFSVCKIFDGLVLGTQSGLIFLPNLKSPLFGIIGYQDSAENPISYSHHLLPLGDSSLVTCASNGVFVINYKTSSITRVDNKQPYFQAFKLNEFEVGLSGLNSFRLLNSSTFNSTLSRKLSKILANDFIIASVRSGDSILFLASANRRGLYVIRLLTSEIQIINSESKPARIEDLAINNLFLNRANELVIVSEQKVTVFNYSEGKIRLSKSILDHSKHPLEILMDVCETSDSYFFAVYGKGIVKTDKHFELTKIISAKEGLMNQAIYKIFCIDDSLLVTGSNNGLFTYRLNSEVIKSYNVEQGTHANSFDETSAAKKGNFVFFGGIKGVTVVQTDKLKSVNSIPKLYFSNIYVNRASSSIDTNDLFINTLKVPSDYRDVSIQFIGIDYYNPGRIRYEYRIEGIQPEWTQLGSEDLLRLIGIPHGQYNLKIRCLGEDGVSSEIKQLTLIFLPKWYQTWWFKVLIGLLVLGIVYGLYRLRINQLKKEEAIRNQLASDLHDDLGSTLNSVKVYANLAMMDKDNNSYLIKIKESTQEAIVGVRDLIWVLDDKKDAVDDLVNRVQQFAGPYCEANGVKLVVELAPDSGRYTLGKEEKRSLYLIMKEFVNNSIKYAQCTEIKLNIAASSGRIAIQISDNGKGFEIEKIKEGNGLRNFKSRAKEIHYSIGMDSIEGAGTRLTLKKA